MRLLKILLGLLIVLGMAVWLSNTSSQHVTIWLYPGNELLDINLAMALVSTLVIGILMGFVVALVQIMTQHRDITQKNRQLKTLRTELNNLRHSGLEDDIFKEDVTSTSEMEDSPVSSSKQLIPFEK